MGDFILLAERLAPPHLGRLGGAKKEGMGNLIVYDSKLYTKSKKPSWSGGVVIA